MNETRCDMGIRSGQQIQPAQTMIAESWYGYGIYFDRCAVVVESDAD